MLRAMLLFPLLLISAPLRAPVAEPPPVQSGTFTASVLDEWLQGTLSGLYVDGGDLRLQDGQISGTYESPPLQAPSGLNAAVLQWHAVATSAQTVTLELRSSVDGNAWSDWQAAAPRSLPDGGALSQLYVLQPFTSWLQYRARLEAGTGSPSLADVAATYLNSTAGPSLVDIVARVPPAGPLTRTPAPPTIAALDWGALPIGGDVERQSPYRVELVEVRASADDPNSAATVRALQWVAQNLLEQEFLPYHYIVDGAGTIYQGSGSAGSRLPTLREGAVAIGLLADMQGEGLSEAAQAALAQLLGWLSEAYGIELSAVEIPPDAAPRLQELLPELRAAADRSVVRSRLYFAAGNLAQGTERLSLLNRGPDEARAVLTALSALPTERRTVVVPAGQRVDLTLNSTFPLSGPLGLEIAVDRWIEAERAQIVGAEIYGGPAVDAPSRAWYFADTVAGESGTSGLELLNPQERDMEVSVTLFDDSDSPISRTAVLGARSRQTLALQELFPPGRYGVKVVAPEPIVAERTVLENGGATASAGIRDLSREWTFAEGSTMQGYTTTLALLNPWPGQVAATLLVISEDGTSLVRRYAVPGRRQLLVPLNDIVPALPFALQLTAERPVAVERVLSFDAGRGASAGPGATRAATRWTFVEGSTAVPSEQFLLVANPRSSPVNLEVAYTLADGRVERRAHTVGARARLAILVNADVPDQPIVSAVVTADRPVVVERTIYTNGPAARGGETSLGIPGD